MKNGFQASNFIRVEISDSGKLIPRLTASRVNSCEFPFGNLYVWGYPCGTSWQEYNGHLYFYLPCMDELYFMDTAENPPPPEELIEIAKAMQSMGREGSFFQVRQEYIDQHKAVLEQYFVIEQLPEETAEYIYSVQALVELKGEKLRKKRNLIKQFERDYPNARLEDVKPGKVLEDCLALAAEWRAGQEDPDTEELIMESEALAHLRDGFDEMQFAGVAVYDDDRLLAFAIYCRINAEMFTESFEKSRFNCKGAAQFVNHAMAKRLADQCLYINREQDLGSAGLRQAKLSYDPILLLRNYALTPR